MKFQGQKNTDARKRFMSNVSGGDFRHCWLYTGRVDKAGYGEFWNGYRNIGAHRYAYEYFHNTKIPDNLCVLHTCDNPPCCNPKHMFLGTHADNVADKCRKNRNFVPTPKLYDEEVWLIKKLYSKKTRQHVIARMFKVHQSTISHAITGCLVTKGESNV